MSQSDFASQLASIYRSKLDIREAIKQMGVSITNDTPFSHYAGKILLIEGGAQAEPQKTTEGLEICESVFEIVYIPAPVYAFYESLSLYGKPGEEINESMEISYPSTSETGWLEVTAIGSAPVFGLAETAELEFSLWAYAESFKRQSAAKYDYNPDWAEFSDNGVYLGDRVFETSGRADTLTENGVIFSAPLPNGQSYGNIITVAARITEAADG